MRMRISKLAIFAVALSGCATQMGHLSVASTKNLEFPGKRKALVKANVKGSDMKSIIVIIPTGQSQIDQAITNAVNSAGGDYMENVKITNIGWWIPYIYGRVGFEVVGDVYRLEKDSLR